MNTKTSLVSLAMLKVNLDDRKSDYLEYLRPFVLHALREHRPQPVTDTAVQQLIATDFGLILPTGGILIILRRLAKKNLLKRNNRVYEITGELPDPRLPSRRADAVRHIDTVVSALQRYALERTGTGFNDEQAAELLTAFLREFGVHCLRAYLRGTALPDVPPQGPHGMYLVSRFITDAMASNAALFDNIIVIVKGQMLANALLCPDLEGLDQTFAMVTFYVDTPLILNLLGLDGAPKELAVKETLALLRQLGGKTAVFEHTRQEVYKVIEGIERNLDNPRARGSIVMEMRRQGKRPSDLTLMRERLDQLLHKNDLLIRNTPAYVIALQIDEAALQGALDEEIEYYNPGALVYDVQSIRSIYVLRQGKAPRRLEDATAVLVSSNRDFARVAYEFGKTHESSREVSSVVTSFSVANVAWLKAPLGAPALPEKEVLAYCYAALEPGGALWDAYLKEIEKLEADGEISPSDHQLLRYSSQAREELMNLTLGDVQDLTQETVTEILRRVEAEVANEKDTLLAQERSRHEDTAHAKAVAEYEHRSLQSRLYWLSDRIGRIAASTLAAVIVTCLLFASALSGMAIEKFLGWRWWLNALIVFGVAVAVVFALAKHFVSVARMHRWVRGRVRYVLFRSLAGAAGPRDSREPSE